MVDVAAVRQALTELIKEKNCGPILIRLAWHDSGTYCSKTKTGGAHACMKYAEGESKFAANAGLDVARDLLQPVKESAAQDMSYADLWALAAVVATKEMGGPDIKFRMGRTDAENQEASVEEGRHPDALQKEDHLREVFGRMGLTDRDIVALSGAHTVGKCHADRSGFDGAWTSEPLKFDNSYFKDLLEKEWEETESPKGLKEFVDKSTGNIMLVSDKCLIEDEAFKAIVEEYAKDQDVFFKDYAAAFQKLIELGYEDKDLQDPDAVKPCLGCTLL
jgi:catalase (peroxidase I)